MNTRSPISTVSFNTEEFLALKLNELVKAKKIAFWAYIVHKPEDDEVANKDHIHVYLEPARQIQTEDLKEFLREFDPTNPSKPRGCINIRTSKFDDWYLYAIHDKGYLAMKGQSRRYHYTYDDVMASDPDELYMKVRQIDMLKISPYAAMESAIKNGISFEEYFRRGTIPIQQLNLWHSAWTMLESDITFRNERKTHSPKSDEEKANEILEQEEIHISSFMEQAKADALSFHNRSTN